MVVANTTTRTTSLSQKDATVEAAMDTDEKRISLESARFRYEWTGAKPEDLAKEYDLPLVVVDNAITEANWTRKINIPKTLAKQEIEDIKDLSLRVAEESRLNLLVFERSLIPKILELKVNILAKTEEALESEGLDTLDLKRLVEVQDVLYRQIQDNLNSKPLDDTSQFNAQNMQINVVQKFNPDKLN